MYSLPEYARMIADPIRMGAHIEALSQALKPGDVVLDLGAGFGFFAVLACHLGARKAYAIEPSDAIRLGREFAAANGSSGQVEFVQNVSTDVNLPERVDLIICDLRGKLPLLRKSILSIIDARERMLKPGGTLIPKRDVIWVGLAQAPELYERQIASLTSQYYGLDFAVLRHFLVNQFEQGRVESSQFLANPQIWVELDYQKIITPQCDSEVTFQVERPGTAHGLSLWFEAALGGGVSYTNAPFAPSTVHGTAFLHFEAPIEVTEGDIVKVRLMAKLVGEDYLWFWDTSVSSRGEPDKVKARFQQGDFYGMLLTPSQLRRESADYIATLNEEGRVRRLILSMMDGRTTLRQIANVVAEQFPQRFPTWVEALSPVAELSRKHSQASL